jgi:hypothetical protein
MRRDGNLRSDLRDARFLEPHLLMVRSAATPRVSNHEAGSGAAGGLILRDAAKRPLLRMRGKNGGATN